MAMGQPDMDMNALVRAAMEAREGAYAPYSGFAVGAALLAEDGRVFCGCNVENAAYGASCCAERVALYKAVSEGVRRFTGIAIAGGCSSAKGGTTESALAETAGDGPEAGVLGACPPCGECRQVLSEFCGAELPVALATGGGAYELHTLGELLPLAFGAACIG